MVIVNQPSGDLASVVIMNKPLEDINDYKLVHEYNKGNLGNHLDGTYVAPPPKYTSTEDRPAATEHIVHYFDGTINATTGDLIDHIGDAVGVLMGTQETGTSEYGFTVKCSNSFYKILYRKYTPVYTNKVTISFYYKTSASGPSTGCTLVGPLNGNRVSQSTGSKEFIYMVDQHMVHHHTIHHYVMMVI